MQKSSRFDILLIAYGLLVLFCAIHGLNITECNGRTGIVNNTLLSNCSYPYLNCSGADSLFCSSATNCSANFTCNETIVTPSDPETPTLATEPPSPTQSPSDVRRQCRQGVTKRFSYPQNCNYFYYCVDGFLLVEQCPIGYAFNGDTGACGGRLQNFVDCTLK
ncbi:hypothetical protein KR074_007997 [Drosophila pseudoananassae]|nr:hypothetical protein KR074_007997 [Drosophila pseudoananassae]